MPRTPTVVLVTLLAVATGAAGPPPPPLTLAPAKPGRSGGPPPGPLFISPSGEPFRMENGVSAWFAAADADHDGKITRDELRRDAARFFRLLDANQDGKLDGFELQDYERERVPEISAFTFDDSRERRKDKEKDRNAAPSAPRFRGAGNAGAARYSLLNEPSPVANGDGDFNGSVSLAEWQTITDRRFDKLDKLKTGVLTLAALLGPAPDEKKKR